MVHGSIQANIFVQNELITVLLAYGRMPWRLFPTSSYRLLAIGRDQTSRDRTLGMVDVIKPDKPDTATSISELAAFTQLSFMISCQNLESKVPGTSNPSTF